MDFLVNNFWFLLSYASLLILWGLFYKKLVAKLLLLSLAVWLLFLDPTISKDIYRYLWDGYIVATHQNPYTNLPNSSAGYFKFIDPSLATVPTPYPPVAQLLFSAMYGFSNLGTLFFSKLLIALPATIGVLLSGSPLILLPVIFETAYAGHIDGILLLFVILAFHLSKKRSLLSSVFIGLSGLIKPYAWVLFLPQILNSKNKLSVVVIACVSVLSWLVVVGPGLANFSSFVPLMQSFLPTPARIPTIISLITWGLGFLSLLHGPKKWSRTMAAYLAGSPVLFPWYLLGFSVLATAEKSSKFAYLVFLIMTLWYLDNIHFAIKDTVVFISYWLVRILLFIYVIYPQIFKILPTPVRIISKNT